MGDEKFRSALQNFNNFPPPTLGKYHKMPLLAGYDYYRRLTKDRDQALISKSTIQEFPAMNLVNTVIHHSYNFEQKGITNS